MFFDSFPTIEHVVNVINSYDSVWLVTEGLKTLDSLEGRWFDSTNKTMQRLTVPTGYQNVTLHSFDCHHINPTNPDESIRDYGEEYMFDITKINNWDYLNSQSSYLHSLGLSVPTNNTQYDVSPIAQLFICSRPFNVVSLVEIMSSDLFEEIMTFSNKLNLTPEHLEEIRDICVGYKILSNEGWNYYEPNSKLTKSSIKYEYFNWKD